MKQEIWLIADKYGVQRMTKRAPSLARQEVAVAVTISIPDTAFRAPTLRAAVEVRDDQIVYPEPTVVVDTVEADDMEAALQELVKGGLAEEVEAGRFSLTEWGRANARRLLRNSPEAQELWAALEANRERIIAELSQSEDGPA